MHTKQAERSPRDMEFKKLKFDCLEITKKPTKNPNSPPQAHQATDIARGIINRISVFSVGSLTESDFDAGVSGHGSIETVGIKWKRDEKKQSDSRKKRRVAGADGERVKIDEEGFEIVRWAGEMSKAITVMENGVSDGKDSENLKISCGTRSK